MRFRTSGRSHRCRLCEWLHELWSKSSDKQFAVHESRIALQAYARVRHEQPALAGRALYEVIIKDCSLNQSERAAEFVRRAEESFADWPTSREVRFCDVVSYVIFDELAVMRNRASTTADIQAAVSKIIPAEL